MPAATFAPRPVSPALSVHLDALRAIAAIWVVLSHMRSWDVASAEVAAWLPLEGHDAVIVFFVLSGFLISHAAARATGPLDFAIDRASRLYSVAMPVLLATWLADTVGRHYAPDAYAGHYEWAKPWIYLPLHLLFLGEAWSLREVPSSIPPYWSLHYEAWYYVAFAALAFLRGAWRVIALAALVAALGPKLLVMWPVWALGAALYLWRARLPLTTGEAWFLLISSVAAYAAIEAVNLDHALWRLGDRLFVAVVGDGPGNARNYLADYIVALLLAGVLLALERLDWQPPPPVTGAIRWAAGYSFTLYLLHGPFLLTLRNALDTGRLTTAGTLAILGALGVATVLVGQVTEKRRHLWRRFLRTLSARLLPGR
ncbi:MAG: acyltransferase [Alphaproteobacteria bacterium]|nr:acyltransferase [Alphaproteobacteria bacterium]